MAHLSRYQSHVQLRWFCVFGICFLTLSMLAQADSTNLLLKAYTTITSKTSLHPGHVTTWRPGMREPDWRSPMHGQIFWVKLDSSSIPQSGLIAIRGQLAVTIWAITERDTTEFKFGLSRPLHRLPIRGASDYIRIEQLPKSLSELFIRITPFAQQPYPVTIGSITSDEYKQLRLKSKGNRLGYHLFLGAGVEERGIF